MPNGRSGGFIMQIVDLKELVRAFPGSTFVGHVLGQDLSDRSGSASDVIALVEECS